MNPLNRQISAALLGLATVFSGAVGAQTLSSSTGTDFGSAKPTNTGRTGACGTVTLTQSTSQAITAANSVSCNAGGLHTDNRYFRAFDLSAFASGFNVCAVEFGVETANAAGATQPVVVNVYSNTGGAFPAGTRTLVGTSNIALPDQTATIVNQALAASLPAGSQLVFEVFTPSGQTAGDSFFIGSNAGGQTAPGYLQAPACMVTTPTPTADIGRPNMHMVMNVIGDPAGSDLVLGAVTTMDTCAALPSNNNTIIEPGEVVSISVPLNASGGAFTNVVGMLTSSTPGVTVVSGVGNYGNIASGGSATANYSIQVAESVACFSTLNLSLAVTSTEENFTFPIARGVGAAASITYNNLPLTIPDNLPAGVSSTAVVSGMPGAITSLQVQVAATHTWVGDLVFTLTSPGGTTITLLDQPGVPATTFGCSNDNVNVTFQDGAANPESICDAVGTVWPVTLAAPVTALAALNGQTGNGTWTMRVRDLAGGDTGTLTNWQLIIAPAPVATCTICPSNADMSITLTDTPDPVTAGTNLTYVATATNNGPAPADAVSISLPLPAGTTFVSATPSTGGSCNAATPVVCTWAGATAAAATRSVTVVAAVPASAIGPTLSATATVASTTQDLNPANNTATATTAVATSANLLLTLNASATQALINVPVTFTATSLNQGPSDAQGVSITMTLTPDFRYTSHTATGATCTTPQVGTTGAIVCTWAGATAPGVTRTLTVVAFSNVEGLTGVNASTTSATTDPVPNNNSGVVSVQVGYAVEEIPTLNAFTMILLGLMLGLIGLVVVRREA